MSNRQLAIDAIKAEAKKNPNTARQVGDQMLTYQEIAERIDTDPKIQKIVLEPYLKLLENPVYKTKILKELGRAE